MPRLILHNPRGSLHKCFTLLVLRVTKSRGEHGLCVTHVLGESYPQAKLGQIAKVLHLQLQPGRAQCPLCSDRAPAALGESVAAVTFEGSDPPPVSFEMETPLVLRTERHRRGGSALPGRLTGTPAH